MVAPGLNEDDLKDCDATRIGRSPLRRLTRTEYIRTVQAVLGVQLDAKLFAEDEKAGRFFSNLTAPVSELAVTQYAEAAEVVASEVRTGLNKLLPCALQASESCFADFLSSVGTKLFRRELSAAETDLFKGLYRTERAAGAAFPGALQTVTAALLQSPAFLYHLPRVQTNAKVMDDGQGGKMAPLDDFSVAARLSYFLWKSSPDEALLQDAAQGRLSTAAQREAAARRLLADPRAEETIVSFYRQWLGVQELLNNAAAGSLRSSMVAETDKLVIDAFAQGQGTFSDLLISPVSFMDSRLAEHYGLPAASDGFEKVQLDGEQRVGILTHASVLSAQRSHVRRGLLIRQALLCHDVPLPPADVDTALPEPTPGQSPRKNFEDHMNNPSCKGCHVLMDPIGFAFERYDDQGRYRETHQGFTLLDVGELTDTRDVDGPFKGIGELSKRLAGSAQVHQCLSRQWFSFAHGSWPGAEDNCSVGEAFSAFAKSGYQIGELLMALVNTPAFTHLRIENAP